MGVQYRFTDDGDCWLEVTDLLGGAAPTWATWCPCCPRTASPWRSRRCQNPQHFLVDPVRGAVTVELTVQRHGYDGEIELSIVDGDQAVELVNPIIPAGAVEARVYLKATADWSADSLAAIRLIGRGRSRPELSSAVTSLNLQRLKNPHVPYPVEWTDGRLLLVGTQAAAAVFTLEAAEPLKFARAQPDYSARLSLKRLAENFKAGVNVLPRQLPAGWSATIKTESDVVTIDWVRGPEAIGYPDKLELFVYAEHQGRGLGETVTLPIEWFDPLQISMSGPAAVVAGSTVALTIRAERQETEAAATLNWIDAPPGLSLPPDFILPAEQSVTTLQLAVPEDFTAEQLQLTYQATSTYAGKPMQVRGQSAPIQIIRLPSHLEVYPAEVVLDGPRSKRQLVVTGFDAAQSARDWTASAEILSADPAIAEVRGSVVHPVSDGATQLVVRVGGVEQLVSVQVRGQQTEARVGFESEVLVALSKQGCNSGACHGSPSGKGMFRLSLRAFDRQLDELTLIREEFGRRVNPVQPEQSLLVLKPLMKVSHGGGKQLRGDDPAHQILLDWICQGANADPPDTPRCVRLEIYPNTKRILGAAGGTQQLAVTAHFADGSQRDVTELAAYESSDIQVASVDAAGLVTAQQRGETVILVRFLEHIETLPLLFIDANPAFAWSAPPAHNFIDELTYAKLRQMQIVPAPTCTDSEFLRRLYLDVIGVLPDVQDTRAFLADDRADKRSRLIDQLLDRDEYARFWALKWGDLLKLTSQALGAEGVHKYHR